MDLSTKDHLHDVMMSCILDRSKNKFSEPMLPQGDLQQFLNVTSSIQVKLSDSASELLKTFYVTSRKVRASASYGTDVPIKALDSMYVLSRMFYLKVPEKIHHCYK